MVCSLETRRVAHIKEDELGKCIRNRQVLLVDGWRSRENYTESCKVMESSPFARNKTRIRMASFIVVLFVVVVLFLVS